MGGATGKLVPSRQTHQAKQQELMVVKNENAEAGQASTRTASGRMTSAPTPSTRANLPMSPQEKMVQVRDLALKHNLDLDQNCLKGLARLPFHKAKDMIDEVLLGGRDRRGVRNPSKYLTIGCQKMTGGLGVEQGLAMELAVSLGVVLNNDALDELASIPRKESHAIIRELAVNPEACGDPLEFICTEVLKCRAQLDARPWPPAG